MNITTVGLDVAKKVFHLVGLDVRGQKNDDNDARAIAEAVRAPWMRFVAVKTVEQQDVQSRVRLREGAINARTAAANRLRGLLGEYGWVPGKSLSTLRRALPEILEDASPPQRSG